MRKFGIGFNRTCCKHVGGIDGYTRLRQSYKKTHNQGKTHRERVGGVKRRWANLLPQPEIEVHFTCSGTCSTWGSHTV